MFATSMPAALHNRPPPNHPPNVVIPDSIRNPFSHHPSLPPSPIISAESIFPPSIPAALSNHLRPIIPCVIPTPHCHSGLDPESMFYVSIALPVTAAHARHQQPEHPVIPGLTRNPCLPLPCLPPVTIIPARSPTKPCHSCPPIVIPAKAGIHVCHIHACRPSQSPPRPIIHQTLSFRT